VLADGEIEVRDGVPVSSALRTAWDLAALESTGTAVAALDAMVRAGAVERAQLDQMAASGTGRWGVTRVRRAFPLIDPRAESAPESRVRIALVLAGLEPVPQYEIRLDGVLIGRADLAFPEERLAIEYEGAYHFEGMQIVRDDARIQRLKEAGWRVIRLSAADLRDLDAVVTRVRFELSRLS
jgi:very-short-patch-repair endonuclease